MAVNFCRQFKYEYVLKICNQRLYLLHQLKKQGLPRKQLEQVFESIVLSRVTYAVAAWWGFTSIAERIELQKCVHKVVRLGVAEIEVSLEDIIDRMELRLFKAAQGHSHSLFHLLPNKRVTTRSMSLRKQGHYFDLSVLKYEVTRKSFINRMLYKYKNIVTA